MATDEPVWPRVAYSEGAGGMAACRSMPVTIFALYEGMRLQLKFLPYEAPYEEVIRRCELALGGVRLPAGVWLNCRVCQRRLSLCNNPQRRMPGQCHNVVGAWEWNVNVPFMAFVSLDPDGVTGAVPLRVPSKNEKMEELARVAARTLNVGHMAAVLRMNGRLLPADKTVAECGVAEGDRLVLELRWRLTALRGRGDNEEEIACQMFGHIPLKELFQSLLENRLFQSFAEVLLGDQCVWRSGEDDGKTLADLGIKDGDTVRIVQLAEHDAALATDTGRSLKLRRPGDRVNSCAQTDAWEEEEEEEVDFS